MLVVLVTVVVHVGGHDVHDSHTSSLDDHSW